MKILAYSDLHYHDYTNGINIGHVEDVELQILDLVKDESPDFIVFCGDRFVSRNPHYDVLYRASQVMHTILTSIKIPFIYLIGNHDQTRKNKVSINTAEHLKLSEYDNLYVLDRKGTTIINGVAFHAVPAESENGDETFSFIEGTNVCLYHGMIKNAKYDTDLVNTDGHDCSFLDDERFNVVICGDNHRQQKLQMFTKTQAWYVGATMQHKWAETEKPRGFMLFDVNNKSVASKHIISRAPQFKVVAMAAVDDHIFELNKMSDNIIGNVVRLKITGSVQAIKSLDLKLLKEYMYKMGAVHADVKPDYIVTHDVKQEAQMSEVDEWEAYAKSKSKDMPGIDIQAVVDLGKKYLND